MIPTTQNSFYIHTWRKMLLDVHVCILNICTLWMANISKEKDNWCSSEIITPEPNDYFCLSYVSHHKSCVSKAPNFYHVLLWRNPPKLCEKFYFSNRLFFTIKKTSREQNFRRCMTPSALLQKKTLFSLITDSFFLLSFGCFSALNDSYTSSSS